jgi:hypothetical protein
MIHKLYATYTAAVNRQSDLANITRRNDVTLTGGAC